MLFNTLCIYCNDSKLPTFTFFINLSIGLPVAQKGIEELIDRVYHVLEETEDIYEEIVEDSFEEITLETEEIDNNFYIEKKDGEFVVTGKPIERLMKKVNVGNFESLQYMQRVLKSMGVMKELEKLGIMEGDTVDILGYKLEYME